MPSPYLSALVDSIEFTNDLQSDVLAFLHHHKCPNTADHCRKVAETAVRLADQFNLNRQQAETAGWLHDISAVVPNPERLAFSQHLELEILPEEAQVPLLLHQKISVEIARHLFSIQDQTILDAIGCHTTLKANPTPLDTLLFVADKISWDQKGAPPYTEALQAALAHSLDEAAWVYQDYLMHSGKLQIAHPWMLASHSELAARFGKSQNPAH